MTHFQSIYKDLHQSALIVAGCFVLVALLLSVFLLFQHLRYYTNPAEQKWIVGVIFMVPIYSTESILSLWNPKLSLVCDILRNCYEAFALYAFGSYLIACLEVLYAYVFINSTARDLESVRSHKLDTSASISSGERKVRELLEDESLQTKKSLLERPETPQLQNRRFCNFILRPCVLGKDLLTIEKFGLVQYMILKTLCAFLAFVLELFGVYGDGQFKWYYGYPYMAVVLNFSQMWALYCLVQFYNVTHERLQAIKPLAKFISFKAIVFATWWQGVGIALLCYFGVLPREENLQTGLQDFLICVEMAVAAIAHIFVFSEKPYHFLPVSEYRKITSEKTEAVLKIKEGDEEKPAILEKKEVEVEAPGTSVKESVQDIVVEGGQKVVKDVVLTINQAIEPVEKGMTKIQETFHEISVSSGENKEEQQPEVKVEEHMQDVIKDGSQVLISAEEKIVT